MAKRARRLWSLVCRLLINYDEEMDDVNEDDEEMDDDDGKDDDGEVR